jgi:5-bromo-4-chloroindolyl phosphate hydrolysis protein
MTTDTTYIELLKMAHESLDSKDIEIAELKEQLEAAMTFNVDVVMCLSRIASVENHNEVPAYIDMSRRCIKTIKAKQSKALKQETFHFNDQDFQPEALKEQE